MNAAAKAKMKKNMIPINMFSQSSLEHIETLMRPNQSSQAGFLNDDECIIDVCEADWAMVEKLKLTFDQFADQLETITQKAGRQIEIGCRNGNDYWDLIKKGGVVIDGLRVTWTSYLGYQSCPCCHFNNDSNWGGLQETLSDTDFTVTNEKTGQQIFFSQLHIHLIRRHHFFEGHTKYRLDPELCAQVLQLKPGVDYKPVYSSEQVWNCTSASSGGNRTFEDYIKEKEVSDFIKAGAQKILCSSNFHAWILNDRLLTISDGVLEHSKSSIIENAVMLRIQYGVSFFERHEHKFVQP